MREYNYTKAWKKLLSPEIVSMLSMIHEFKGEQNLFIEAKSDTLTQLVEIAKIQSTEASNRIEGIYTSDERLKQLVSNKTMPQSRNEQEIAGYRDVLSTIHESYEFIPVKPPMILQLHRDLYKFSGKSIGGTYKNSDNVIAEEDSQGNRFIRFQPVPAWETAESIESLCKAFDDEMSRGEADPLLIIPMFILDFLCIHPFNDGNGRMSRLLTLLLLYKANYLVGKYISIEKIIENTKESYYDTLQKSSVNWHNNKNDYSYFVEYSLGIILNAYKELDSRINSIENKKIRSYDKIINIFKENIIPIDKSLIISKCPDLSETTIERILNRLLKEDKIIKISGGRYTKYKWNM